MGEKLNISQAILHITYVCTHHCPMCYANAGNNHIHPPIRQLYQVVDKLIDIGINDITLVGGDPALYPDIISLVRYLKKNNIKISILSNTLDFNSSKSEVVDCIDVFEGTIHHSIKEKHDKFCGQNGAYANLVDNLKYFSYYNKSVGLAINLIPFNYDVVYDIISNVIAQNVKLDHIVLQRIIQFGRATDAHKYELTRTMIEKILYKIEKAEKEFDLKIVFEDPIPMCSIEDRYRKYMHPCEWGITKISVDYNGAFSRCGADVFHSFGSVFDEDIIEKWNTNTLLKRFRNKSYLPHKCIACEYFAKCGGGCPISRNPEKGFSVDYLANQ